MQRNRKLLLIKGAVCLGLPALAWGFLTGPDAGYSGAPNDLGDCTSCHLGKVNSHPGSVSVAFSAGLHYLPGVTQHLMVTIADPTQRAWGFQLTARTANDTTIQAGALAPTDANTQLMCSSVNFSQQRSTAVCPDTLALGYIEHTFAGYQASLGQTGSFTYQFDWTPPATDIGNVVVYVAGNAANGDGTSSGDHIYTAGYTLTPQATFSSLYYFPHMVFGGGWQTTLTYVNYSPQAVTCQTTFFSNSGQQLAVPFGSEPISTRTDLLPPGGDLHEPTQASGDLVEGWATGQCTGPVKASLLYRFFDSLGRGAEVGVDAVTSPTTKFVTFAETHTGVAFANPSSSQTANIIVRALPSNPGPALASQTISLAPGAHQSANLGPLLGLPGFIGSVQIISDNPIVSLSLNAEATSPTAGLVISSVPPGDLDASTQLPTATGSAAVPATASGNLYYFPQFTFGGGWQTTLTLVNYSTQTVSCQTSFYSDSGAALPVPFGDTSSGGRTDLLGPAAVVHVQTQSAGNASISGWAQAQCTGPVKASLLYRFFDQNGHGSEVGVSAVTAPATELASFAEAQTGIAFANPSTSSPANISVIALSSDGSVSGTPRLVTLGPGAHTAFNLGLSGVTGSIQITSDSPIVCLALNAEATTPDDLVISSLPSGELNPGTPLATGH